MKDLMKRRQTDKKKIKKKIRCSLKNTDAPPLDKRTRENEDVEDNRPKKRG